VIAAICLLQAPVIFAGIHDFPSDDSTVVGSVGFIDSSRVGYFWSSSRGDLVSETFADPLTSVSHAAFDFEVVSNNLNPGFHVDWDVLINGTTVGGFMIYDGFTGQASLNLDFSPIANVAGEYTVSFVVTNEVPDGDGSISLAYDAPYAHSVELTSSTPEVTIDIKPGSCPNPFNGKSQGSVPVAILGSAAFDVTEVDLDSLRLEGVPIVPKNVWIEDVSAPVGDPADCYDCFDEEIDYLDGYDDLVVKFYTQDLAAVIGPAPRDECVLLTLTGSTLSGEEFEASDSMVIKTKIKD
jgi:hypothetical protein